MCSSQHRNKQFHTKKTLPTKKKTKTTPYLQTSNSSCLYSQRWKKKVTPPYIYVIVVAEKGSEISESKTSVSEETKKIIGALPIADIHTHTGFYRYGNILISGSFKFENM